MFFIEWTIQMLQNDTFLFHVILLSTVALLIAALVAFCNKDKATYFAVYFLSVGISYVAMSAKQTNLQNRSFCVAVVSVVCSLLYFLLQIAFTVERRIENRKKNRENYRRQLQYTLPDHDNSFVRSRLNTALRLPNAPNDTHEPTADAKAQTFRMQHARQLLTKIKNAPLTKAERLQTEDAERLFSAYVKKERWSADDVRLINELFSYLLKLSAKYSV
ncbi:MAG: hypothetical protein IJX87_06120 [Clostridia bacterium]|nr:hypothetical protein [Clostridia bacterium]